MFCLCDYIYLWYGYIKHFLGFPSVLQGFQSNHSCIASEWSSFQKYVHVSIKSFWYNQTKSKVNINVGL